MLSFWIDRTHAGAICIPFEQCWYRFELKAIACAEDALLVLPRRPIASVADDQMRVAISVAYDGRAQQRFNYGREARFTIKKHVILLHFTQSGHQLLPVAGSSAPTNATKVVSSRVDSTALCNSSTPDTRDTRMIVAVRLSKISLPDALFLFLLFNLCERVSVIPTCAQVWRSGRS